MTSSPKPTNRAIGGRARASALTSEQRTEIAKKAAQSRWSAEAPKATHTGIVNPAPKPRASRKKAA